MLYSLQQMFLEATMNSLSYDGIRQPKGISQSVTTRHEPSDEAKVKGKGQGEVKGQRQRQDINAKTKAACFRCDLFDFVCQTLTRVGDKVNRGRGYCISQRQRSNTR